MGRAATRGATEEGQLGVKDDGGNFSDAPAIHVFSATESTYQWSTAWNVVTNRDEGELTPPTSQLRRASCGPSAGRGGGDAADFRGGEGIGDVALTDALRAPLMCEHIREWCAQRATGGGPIPEENV